jgi:hypothetical protein
MAERKDNVADNAVADRPLIVSREAQASAKLPPWLDAHWESEDFFDNENGVGVGVIRVHVNPGGEGAAIEVHLEDGETGFEAGAHVSLGYDDALDLAEAIRQTAEASRR